MMIPVTKALILAVPDQFIKYKNSCGRDVKLNFFLQERKDNGVNIGTRYQMQDTGYMIPA